MIDKKQHEEPDCTFWDMVAIVFWTLIVAGIVFGMYGQQAF